VEIFSQGEVIELGPRFYPGFGEAAPFHPGIPVSYASALPIRFLNGIWSSWRTAGLFKARHRAIPFDLAIIYNLKLAQISCAKWARRVGMPVVLEYEDDAFVDLAGEGKSGWKVHRYLSAVKQVFELAAGVMAVSPHLLAQLRSSIPKLLLRGVVSDEIVEIAGESSVSRENRVVFSGTLFRSKGLEQLIEGWKSAALDNWELHIAGEGELSSRLRDLGANVRGIVFHGLLNRHENALLLASAKIGINPHDLSKTPGNVFAFKIIEYLAAGAHVISTPMGPLEPEIEKGISYMPDNKAETIAATLKRVVTNRDYERTAMQAALQSYGPDAVARSLDNFLARVVVGERERKAA
jgi:glycosyltransferase involved in cell wall biosynthesis